jgi:hypothetical protein
MTYRPAGRETGPGQGVHRYEHHRPEQTLLYQLVEQHYLAFVAQLATQGTPLPEYVQREFEDYLECGRLEHGFLRVRCTVCYRERLAALVANVGVFARAAGRGAWPRVPPCWSTTSCRRLRCASGC